MKEFVKNELKLFLKRIKEHKAAFPFLQHIEEIISQIPYYTTLVPSPIDLHIVEVS